MAISPYAHSVLNAPELIQKRDVWFDRMPQIFDREEGAWADSNLYAVNGIVGHSSQYDPFRGEREAVT